MSRVEVGVSAGVEVCVGWHEVADLEDNTGSSVADPG
jgi:hypothetical protein